MRLIFIRVDIHRPAPLRFGENVHSAIPNSNTGPSNNHAFKLTFCLVHGGPRSDGEFVEDEFEFRLAGFGKAAEGPPDKLWSGTVDADPESPATTGTPTGSPAGELGEVDVVASADDSGRWSIIGNLTIPRAGNNKAKELDAQIKIKPVNFNIASDLHLKRIYLRIDSKLSHGMRGQ